MKMLSIVFVASTMILAGSVAPKPAVAGDNFAAGLFGGLAAGTILGAATAGPRYYAPAPVYVAPAPVYVGPECYWTRGAPVWDQYRGIWIRPRLRVCD